MFKFFRRIRQNLVSEGRVSKYILYALGEIVLVVIGILIALSINNWNTERNEDAIAGQYTTRLTQELQQDVANYERLKGNFTRQNEAISRFIRVFNADKLVITDTTEFWRDFMSISSGWPWYKEPVIWTQLVQSGELKFIENQEAIEALFDHYSRVRRTAENYNQYPMETTNEIRKMVALMLAESKSGLPMGNRLQEHPPDEMLQAVMDHRDAYQKMLYRLGIISRVYIQSMQNLIESAEEVITLLEKND